MNLTLRSVCLCACVRRAGGRARGRAGGRAGGRACGCACRACRACRACVRACARGCVCVCTICIDVRLLYCAGGQQPIFLCCPTKLRKMWWMGSWTHEPVPAIYIYIDIYNYIVPPLGAFKSQLGGHISYRCCFIRSMSTVILPIYFYIL